MAVLAEEEFQRFGAVARDEHLVREVATLERSQGEIHIVGIVFDQQDLDFRKHVHKLTRRDKRTRPLIHVAWRRGRAHKERPAAQRREVGSR